MESVRTIWSEFNLISHGFRLSVARFPAALRASQLGTTLGVGELEPIPRACGYGIPAEDLKQHLDSLSSCHIYHTLKASHGAALELDDVAGPDLAATLVAQQAMALAPLELLDLAIGDGRGGVGTQQPTNATRCVYSPPAGRIEAHAHEQIAPEYWLWRLDPAPVAAAAALQHRVVALKSLICEAPYGDLSTSSLELRAEPALFHSTQSSSDRSR